jgi:hypothetical protein
MLIRGIIDRAFDGFARFARALLNSADQLLFMALDKLQVVIGQLAPLLFEFPFDHVPVPFRFQFVHDSPLCLYVHAPMLLSELLLPLV